MVAKRLELLHEAAPAASTIGLLSSPANPSLAESELREAQAAARILGVRLVIANASNASEIGPAFGKLIEQRCGAVVISSDANFNDHRQQIIALAAHHAVPAIYQWPEYPAAGGLMSYGPSLSEAYRIVGNYTGRILKGQKPAELPVQQVTKIELIINMKSAKALGLTFPLTLIGRADEVIE